MIEEAPGIADDIGAWLASCARDPLKFVLEGFRWGHGDLAHAKGPEPWQRWATAAGRW